MDGMVNHELNADGILQWVSGKQDCPFDFDLDPYKFHAGADLRASVLEWAKRIVGNLRVGMGVHAFDIDRRCLIVALRSRLDAVAPLLPTEKKVKRTWKPIFKSRDGHRYFRGSDGVVGIADDSGSDPDCCEPADCPPLLLDQTRAMFLLNAYDSTYSIPVIDAKGQRSRTIAPADEASWLNQTFLLGYGERCVVCDRPVDVGRRCEAHGGNKQEASAK